MNIFAAVADPLICLGTAPWIVTTKAVLVNPMPIPTKKLDIAAHKGPEDAFIMTNNADPMTRKIPPINDTLKVPHRINKCPAKDEAIGQPIDIAVNVNPAIIAGCSITPVTYVGK